jgi:hypothetical protein
MTPRQLSDMAQANIMNKYFIEFATKLEFTKEEKCLSSIQQICNN